MKTRALIAFCSICLFQLSSCEDMEFIQEQPESDFFLADINEETLEGVILGMYEPMTRSRGRLWESRLIQHLTYYEDFSFGAGQNEASYNWENNDRADMWNSFYEAIGRANFIISSVEGNASLSDESISSAIGEAKFVRAICYYNLVRIFGEVPLRTEPVANANETGIPLESTDNIYEQIINDLLDAEGSLPSTVPESMAGRATQGAAMTALADVYLTRSNFSEARAKALEVMNNTSFGYALEPSLELLFSATSPTNLEEIFAIKFAQIPFQGSFLPAYAHDGNAREVGFASRGLRFFHTYRNVPFIANWDEMDIRKSFNLYDSLTVNGERVRANARDFAILGLPQGDYLYGKYKDSDATEETGAGNDVYLYRYADVLLIFAEAENQVNGPTSEAYEAINQVRRRGYGLDINTASTVADLPLGLSRTEFDELVVRERAYEFFFEGKRWYDLKRKGIWEEKAIEAGKPSPTRQFLAIPAIERLNNPAID